MTVVSYRPDVVATPTSGRVALRRAGLDRLARQGRILSGADFAAVVSLVGEGLRVEGGDPPGVSPSPDAVIGLPPAMLPVAGLLAHGLLRWSRMPAGSEFAHAALVSLPPLGGDRYLMMIATRDRMRPFEEEDLLILGHLQAAATAADRR